MLESVFFAVGGSSVLLVVVAFLAKSLVSGLLEKDLSDFKNNLKMQSDSAIERLKGELQMKSASAIEQLKSELQITTIEHQVRFSKLHENRAEVIAELYKNLVQAINANLSAAFYKEMSGESEKGKEFIAAVVNLGEFYDYFNINRIYLSNHLCHMLDEMWGNLTAPTYKYRDFLEKKISSGIDLGEEEIKAWDEAWNSMVDDIPPIRQVLENEFRSILGVK